MARWGSAVLPKASNFTFTLGRLLKKTKGSLGISSYKTALHPKILSLPKKTSFVTSPPLLLLTEDQWRTVLTVPKDPDKLKR